MRGGDRLLCLPASKGRVAPLRVLTFALTCGLSLLGGCTVLTDLGAYDTDVGCDLRAGFRGFGPHASADETMYLRVEMESSTSEASALTGSYVIQPLPGSDFDLNVPGGVFSAFEHVDYFIDVNGDALYTPVDDLGARQDEGWIYERPCVGDGPLLTYDETFFDFDEPTPLGRDLELTLLDLPPFEGPVEVRAYVEDPEIGEHTLCFYRGPSTEMGALDVMVPRCVPPNSVVHVEVWVDENDDNNVDPWPAETAFGFDLPVADLAAGPVEVRPPVGMAERPHSGVVVLTLIN